MKILITHERFAPDFAGGGEYVVLEIARHLIRRGHSVHVLTTGDPAITSYDDIPTTRLGIHRYRFNFASRTIEKHARGADIIHTFNYNACYASLIAGRRLNIPVVCSILGLFGTVWREMKGPILGRVFEMWERQLLKLPFARIIFMSEFSRDLGIQLGASAANSMINEPGIDHEAYQLHYPKEERVLFVGKIEVRKGIDTILDVARRLPQLPFRIFGWDQYHPFQEQAPANVEFVNFERGKRLAEEFSKAKYFLFPSRAETFGIAIVEAMASGCVVMSTIPLDFEGVHLQDTNPDRIAAEITRLQQNDEEVRRIAMTNRERSAKYNWDHHIENLESMYDDILNRMPRHPDNRQGTEQRS
jgi:1,4-alpha-glucan branching enzyme